ncbi:3-deoxy-manno-octulosonate cytidylyltransferase [Priestia aryabhattai]|uniref:3-deoxy-manno-octulosonate cytidylyltransferase n=1 Tax=Priestia aryabhattai TaxID=412384 RepID=UPI000532A6E1|nr:3-deoxy-manno-octulosonate cytidylyltransferase [Priestia aryabhattai]
MKVTGIIPARMGSTRLPGKPLLDICGKTMIQRVYERALQSDLDDLIIACDDVRIYEVVKSFGGKVVMTSKTHINGSTRIAEVAKDLSTTYIINIQGDEPLISFKAINKVISELKTNESKVVTLKTKISDKEDILNVNNVKVVCDNNDYALYFSRSPIPAYKENEISGYYKHIGIYGYEREFLLKYVDMKSTPLEKRESLEQLRILENQYKIKVIETNEYFIGVDTQEDLDKVRSLISIND